MKKIKATITIDINQYENIKPEIEINVPDDLEGVDLVKWLHQEYHAVCNYTAIQEEIIMRARKGLNILVDEWEKYIAPYPNIYYRANEAKKEYKRSKEYKDKLEKRQYTDLKAPPDTSNPPFN